MYAVPKTRTIRGFSAPLGTASCTVKMHVFHHNLQKNSKKAFECHRLSRLLCELVRTCEQPGSRAHTHARTHARTSGTTRFLFSSMLFTENAKKALTARFVLTMIET